MQFNTDSNGRVWVNDAGVPFGVEVLGIDADGTVNVRHPVGGGSTVLHTKATPADRKAWEGVTRQSNQQYQTGTTAPAAEHNVGAMAQRSDPLDARIKAFLDQLNQPLNLDDPYVKQIIRGASTAAQSAARNAGIEGGLSAAATEQNTASAMAGLEGQRLDRYSQGLSLANQRDLGKAQIDAGLQSLAEQQYRYDVDQGMQKAAGPGAFAGSILGALPGLIAAPFTGGQSLNWVAPGMQTGGMFGAGLGTMGYNAPARPGLTRRSYSYGAGY